METTPTVRRVRPKSKQVAGRARDKKQQSQIRTPVPAGNGFLRHSFLPLYCVQTRIDGSQKEQDFFASLQRLNNHYGLQQSGVKETRYPYNILLAFEKAKQQLCVEGRSMEISIQQNDDGKICLCTVETFNPGTTLYYIPVIPLLNLLGNKKHKRTGELLLSVFAYLYQVAGVPYYRDEKTYMYDQYEWIGEWQEGEYDDEGGYNENISQLNAAAHWGDIMGRKIYNAYQLNNFAQRIDNYIPQDKYQRECLDLSKSAFHLFDKYPSARIFRHTDNEFTDDEQYDGVMCAEQYVSFVAQTDGELYHHLQDMINDQFNEYGAMEMPILTKCFDNNFDCDTINLDFERRLFTVMNDLCYLLNNLP